jgi:hypothetical protein
MVLLFKKFRAAEYPPLIALALGAAAVLHPRLHNAPVIIASLLFAITVYWIAVAAIAFARNQDPRRTVLFGTSLAGAQLVSPVCGALSTISFSLMLRSVLFSGEAARTGGQLTSLLFLPALATCALIYYSLTYGTPAVWVGHLPVVHAPHSSWVFLRPIAITAPLLLWIMTSTQDSEIGRTVGALCVIIIATGVANALLEVSPSLDVTWAVGPLTVLVLSGQQPDDGRIQVALLVMLSCVIGWWLLPPLVTEVAGA